MTPAGFIAIPGDLDGLGRRRHRRGRSYRRVRCGLQGSCMDSPLAPAVAAGPLHADPRDPRRILRIGLPPEDATLATPTVVRRAVRPEHQAGGPVEVRRGRLGV